MSTKGSTDYQIMVTNVQQELLTERLKVPSRIIRASVDIPIIFWDGEEDTCTFLAEAEGLVRWKNSEGIHSVDPLDFLRTVFCNSWHLWGARGSLYQWQPDGTFRKPYTIRDCRITAYPQKRGDPMPEVWATFSDGTEKRLFSFYPDEINFGADEFIGLTAEEASALFCRRDTAYLRS